MRSVFFEGVAMAQTIDVRGYVSRKDFLDPVASEIDDFAGMIFRNYVDDWWLQLEYTTREQLRAAIMRASIDGTGVKGVIKDIEPLFGEVRAKRIGVTETTRLFGRGALATYMATAMEGWEWQTVSDGRVCPVCIGRLGHQYPIEHPFDPAHVSCRCFPLPVLRLRTST
jgi:SPP1 gp7 family putative phage head morphogenesis protein